jgi:hypothetical protein
VLVLSLRYLRKNAMGLYYRWVISRDTGLSRPDPKSSCAYAAAAPMITEAVLQQSHPQTTVRGAQCPFWPEENDLPEESGVDTVVSCVKIDDLLDQEQGHIGAKGERELEQDHF